MGWGPAPQRLPGERLTVGADDPPSYISDSHSGAKKGTEQPKATTSGLPVANRNMKRIVPRPIMASFLRAGPLASVGQRLLSGGAWALAGKVATVLAALIVNGLLARLISPREMGAYFLTLSLVTVSARVAQLGLNRAVVRLVAEAMGSGFPGRARAAIWLVSRLGLLGAVLVGGILALGLGKWVAVHIFASSFMASVTGLAAFWTMALALQSLLAETFRGFHDIRLATLFGGLFTAASSCLLFGGVYAFRGQGTLGEVMSLVVATMWAGTLLAGLIMYRRVILLEEAETHVHTREVFSIAWPLWVTGLTFLLITQMDMWVLGAFRSQDEVAVYGAATRLVQLVAMPLLIVNAVVPPLVAEMYAKGKRKELERALRTVATLCAAPAVLTLLVFVFGGHQILGWVYGPFYGSGAMVLAVLCLGQTANVWAGSCGVVLMMTGHQTTMMAIAMGCGLLAFSGSLLVVRELGSLGVASVTATSMILQNALMLGFAKKRCDIWTHAGISHVLRRQPQPQDESSTMES